MPISEIEICDCDDPTGSSERNEEGFITHGLILGGCGKIRRTVVFWCNMCEELSASVTVNYVKNNNQIFYCDPCRREYGVENPNF